MTFEYNQKKRDAQIPIKQFIKGIAVSNKMLEAAQASYIHNPEYYLTDADMKAAIHAALQAF